VCEDCSNNASLSSCPQCRYQLTTFKGTVAWTGFFAHCNLCLLVIMYIKYFWFLFTKWSARVKLMYICVLGEYAYILSTFEENTHLSFLRIWRIRLYPFCVLWKNKNTRKGFVRFLFICRKDLRVFFYYPESKYAFSPKTHIPFCAFYTVLSISNKFLSSWTLPERISTGVLLIVRKEIHILTAGNWRGWVWFWKLIL